MSKKLYKNQKFIAVILIILWMILIFWFSSHNAVNSTNQSSIFLHQFHQYGVHKITMHQVRKSAHVILYFFLGGLMINLLKSYPLARWKYAVYSIIFCAFYAATDEFHQHFVAGRSSQISDVVLDSCAAAIGVMAYLVITRLVASRCRHAENS